MAEPIERGCSKSIPFVILVYVIGDLARGLDG